MEINRSFIFIFDQLKEGLTSELDIGREFAFSRIDDAGNFKNASSIHLSVLCVGEEGSSVSLEWEVYKISVIKSKIISELVFKSGLTDNAETNLRHRNVLTDIDDFKMSRSKAVFLCDLRNDEDIKVAEVLYSVNFETLKMTQIRIHKWNTFPLFENGFASFLESDAGTGN